MKKITQTDAYIFEGDAELKRKVEIFRNTCRVYYPVQKLIAQKESRDPWLKTADPNNPDLSVEDRQALINYNLMKKDIETVDSTFVKIEKTCGSLARYILWDEFVNNIFQQEVAQSYGFSRRQLQYSIDKWMFEVFEEDGADGGKVKQDKKDEQPNG